MILRPTSTRTRGAPQSGASAVVPIWHAISATQQQAPGWFITQADHAHLAGDIARSINAATFPHPESDILRAISLHDEGWRELDSGDRVCSFITVAPAEFLPAWQGSIAAAEQVSALGGAVVSAHFVRLAKMRKQMVEDLPADRISVEGFLKRERERRRKVLRSVPTRRIEQLTDVLQFCDVFSLYLCCGASEAVKFPQIFADRSFELRRHNDEYVSSPPLFATDICLQVPAYDLRRDTPKSQPVTVNFRLR